jgi:ADP-ribosyltransferase exoenzyme
MDPLDLPDVHFGSPGSPRPNWREVDDEDPDDEELDETPEAVIMMLGFDPKHMDEPDPDEPQQPTGDAEFVESEHKRDTGGKFSSTGGGGGSAKGKFMGSAPKGQSKITALPALAKKMHEESGKMPTPAEFHEAVTKAGFVMNPTQSAKYMKMYKPTAEYKPSAASVAAAKAYNEAKTTETPSAAGAHNLLTASGYYFKSEHDGLAVYTHKVGNYQMFYDKKNGDWKSVDMDDGTVLEQGNGLTAMKKYVSEFAEPPAAAPENLAAKINAEVKKADPAGATAAAAYNAATSKAAEKTSEEHKKETKEIAAAGGMTPTQMITNAAAGLGYPKEGTYNGIEYFKAASGHKLSYKPDTDTWQATGPNKEVLAKGEGMLPALAWLQHNKQEIKAPSGSPPFAHTATATAAAPPATSTEGSKKYGYNAIAEDKFKYTSKGAANEKALPPKVQDAIHAYKGNSHYDAINDYMRFGEQAGHDTISAERMGYVLNLEKGFQQIAPTKNDITVGRKIGITALKAWASDAGIKDLNDLKAGDMLTDPGVISTSHNLSMGWSGNVRCIIKVPKGSKAIDISETINKPENEMLLPPRSRFKVVSVEKGKGGDAYHINMELVNPKYE